MAIGVARLLTGYIHLAPARPGAAADAVYPSCFILILLSNFVSALVTHEKKKNKNYKC